MTLGTFTPAMAALGCLFIAGRALAALTLRQPLGEERRAVITSLGAALITPVLLWLMLNQFTSAGTLELF